MPASPRASSLMLDRPAQSPGSPHPVAGTAGMQTIRGDQHRPLDERVDGGLAE